MNRRAAFTIIELVVVIATLAVLAVMLLPALATSRTKSQKISCVNNLKQVGVAFREWEGSNNGKYPMAVLFTAGGDFDLMNHGGTISGVIASSGVPYVPGLAFLVMSNELVSPQVLFCPADNLPNHYGAATNFTYPDLLGIAITPPKGSKPSSSEGSVSLTKLSYFIGGDALEADPQSIIAGDCNIGTSSGAGNPAASRFAGTTGATEAGTSSMGPAFTTSALGSGAGGWAWTANDLHQKTGNLLLADGSVQSTTVNTLHTYMLYATNSVQYPCWNFNP